MKVTRGFDDPRELVIRFRAREHSAGFRAVDSILEDLPEGYGWLTTTVKKARAPREGKTQGRQVSATIVLVHNDSRHPAMTFEAAEIRWKHAEQDAQ